jgi:hypothetical protein
VGSQLASPLLLLLLLLPAVLDSQPCQCLHLLLRVLPVAGAEAGSYRS